MFVSIFLKKREQNSSFILKKREQENATFVSRPLYVREYLHIRVVKDDDVVYNPIIFN